MGNCDAKDEKINLSLVESSNSNMVDGVSCDIWYDAHEFGDDASGQNIEEVQDAMLYIGKSIPAFVESVRLLNKTKEYLAGNPKLLAEVTALLENFEI